MISKAAITRAMAAMAQAGTPARCVLLRPDGSVALLTDPAALDAVAADGEQPDPALDEAAAEALARAEARANRRRGSAQSQDRILARALAMAAEKGPRRRSGR